jgi:hypothetical protein
MTKYLTTARKALIALVGVVAQAVSLGVLHGTVLAYAQVVLALATAVGVYVVPNKAAA